jgi:hypothetical protein
MSDRPTAAPGRTRSGGAADIARFATMGVTGVATFGLVGYFGLTDRSNGAEVPGTAVTPAPTPTAPQVGPMPTTAVPLTTLLPATTASLAPTTIPATSPPPPVIAPPPPVDVVSEQSE